MNNWANSSGPKPGSDRAVKQHQAIAQGYEVASSPTTVNVQLGKTSTGSQKVPGLTMRKGR